jgi:hypothetical protein
VILGFQASAWAAVARMHGSLEECVIVRILVIHDERGLITLLISHILILNMQSFGMRMKPVVQRMCNRVTQL